MKLRCFFFAYFQVADKKTKCDAQNKTVEFEKNSMKNNFCETSFYDATYFIEQRIFADLIMPTRCVKSHSSSHAEKPKHQQKKKKMFHVLRFIMLLTTIVLRLFCALTLFLLSMSSRAVVNTRKFIVN